MALDIFGCYLQVVFILAEEVWGVYALIAVISGPVIRFYC